MQELFYLLCGHALADFTFQTDTMARGKNRNRLLDINAIPTGQKYVPCWPYWLSAHALIHGGMVGLVTGNVWLGIAETILHWAIDFGKCENWYGVHEDQAMHIGCKILWFIL